MKTLLSNIDNTLFDGDVFVIKQRIIEFFVSDLSNYIYNIHNSKSINYNIFEKKIHVNTLIRNLLNSFKLYQFKKIIGLNDDEITIFVNSKYILNIDTNDHVIFDQEFINEINTKLSEIYKSKWI